MSNDLVSAFQAGRAAAMKPTAIMVAHWNKLYENFNLPPLDFYAGLERAISHRQIPEIKLGRVEWKEGGLFSANREYLRLEWKRYVCDICAAPFGTGFFFSSWLLMRPKEMTWRHWAGMATTLLVLTWLFTSFLGFWKGSFILLIGMAGLFLALRNGAIRTNTEVEEFLLGLTVIGPILDLFRRSLTFYEVDTASMFQAATHAALLEAIDEVTKARGLPALTELERKPILQEFFRR